VFPRGESACAEPLAVEVNNVHPPIDQIGIWENHGGWQVLHIQIGYGAQIQQREVARLFYRRAIARTWREPKSICP
jgi:hypothetical protein